MNTAVQTKPGVKTFLLGALIAGVIGAILNNLYAAAYTALTGVSVPDIIHVGSVTMASIVPVLIGGLIYFALSRFTPKATLIFVIAGIVFTLFSFGGPLQPQLPDGTPAPEGFAGLTLPMHIISGVVTLWVLPRYVHRKKLW